MVQILINLSLLKTNINQFGILSILSIHTFIGQSSVEYTYLRSKVHSSWRPDKFETNQNIKSKQKEQRHKLHEFLYKPGVKINILNKQNMQKEDTSLMNALNY